MLPAYGRALREMREAGRKPASPVYIADSWELAKELMARHQRFVLVALLPAEPIDPKSPTLSVRSELRFDFSMVWDLDVVICDVQGVLGWRRLILPQVRSVGPRSIRVLEPELDDILRQTNGRWFREFVLDLVVRAEGELAFAK